MHEFENNQAIADFYNGRSVFITGATGFMGKVLVEKLLRCCPGINKVFILVRPKRGKDVTARVEDMFSWKLFETLSEQQPQFLEKVIALQGDMVKPGLGLSEQDMETLAAQVSVVFHSAATVKFDEPLRVALDLNVLGTRRIIQLCKRIPKLEALVHVSTAFANCDRHTISEVLYQPPIAPQKIIEASEWMSDDALDALTPGLIHPRPNTYTFSKALAEDLLAKEGASLPVAIIRPSIVGATYAQPMPGWIDNFSGATGMITAVGKALLNCMPGLHDGAADIIPCDYAVNVFIAAARHVAIERPSSIPVFNVTTGGVNKLTWGDIERLVPKNSKKYPFLNPIRLVDPKGCFTESNAYFRFWRFFSHDLQAWCLDLMLKLAGKKPMVQKFQAKIWAGVDALTFFTMREWTFTNDNTVALYSSLSPEDKQEFNFDVTNIQWEHYLDKYHLGIREHCMKEPLSTLPKARMQYKRLEQIWRVVNTIKLMTFIFVLSRIKVTRDLLRVLLSAFSRLGASVSGFLKIASS